jgi:ubiquitin-protein ligase
MTTYDPFDYNCRMIFNNEYPSNSPEVKADPIKHGIYTHYIRNEVLHNKINNDDKFYFIVGPLERKDESIWIG